MEFLLHGNFWVCLIFHYSVFILKKKNSCELVPIMRREHSLPSWQMAAEKKSWKVTSAHMGSWNRLANFFLTSKNHSCRVLSSYFWNKSANFAGSSVGILIVHCVPESCKWSAKLLILLVRISMISKLPLGPKRSI